MTRTQLVSGFPDPLNQSEAPVKIEAPRPSVRNDFILLLQIGILYVVILYVSDYCKKTVTTDSDVKYKVCIKFRNYSAVLYAI